MKRIDTDDGRFAAGNPQTGTPGTMVSSRYMNDLQDEVCNVITEAGIELAEADTKQLYKAVKKIVASSGLLFVPTTPEEQLETGLIFVQDRLSFHTWVNTAHYTGYRSLRCGSFVWGDTPLPRPDEIEAEGDVINGADYPSLVAHFKETGQIKPIANWVAGEWFLGDMGGGQYRLPDAQNQFIRATGTNLDTANVRGLGTKQTDALQNITGSFKMAGSPVDADGAFSAEAAPNRVYTGTGTGTVNTVSFSPSLVARTSTETRPASTAFHPRMRL